MKTDQARAEIFARLRHASIDASAEQICAELQTCDDSKPSALADEDIALAFAISVLRHQGSLAIANNRSATVKAIGQYLYQRHRTQKLVAGNDSRLAALPWRDAGLLPRFDSASDGDLVGLSYAHTAVAETGATVTFTGRHNPSRNQLLVEDHIVLVERKDLVANLNLAWQRLKAEFSDKPWPRGLHFIAGPSSTADIALQLVMGAHGPRNWHVILIGEELDEGLVDKARALV